MAEPDCFSCLEKEQEEALRRYLEQELDRSPSGVSFCSVRCRGRPRHERPHRLRVLLQVQCRRR